MMMMIEFSFNRFRTSPTSFQLTTTLVAHLVYIMLSFPIRQSRPCLTPSIFSSASPADFPWQQWQQRAQKERVRAPLLRTIRPHPAVGVAWTHYPANGAAGLRWVELLPLLLSFSLILSLSFSSFILPSIPSSLNHTCTASLLATEGNITTRPCTAGGLMSTQPAKNQAQTHSVKRLALNILYWRESDCSGPWRWSQC